MVKVKEDLTGQIFERLTVIEQTDDYVMPNGQHISRWLCRCSCEDRNLVKVVGSKFKNGHTQSCGCLQRERTALVKKKINQFSEKMVDGYGEYYIGYTSNTNQEFYIDADDFEKIKNYCWYEHVNNTNGYHVLETQDPETKKHIKMHWIVADKNYDHADRNPLNNRKYNLRPATYSENSRNCKLRKNNTSGITGVSWDNSRQSWEVQISVNKKPIHIGRFKDKEVAIIARLNAEKEYFGEFAPQRHLFEQYEIN